MTQDFLGRAPIAKVFPPHSEQCFIWPGEQCRACNDLLGPYPPSQWRDVWQKHQAKLQGLPELLPNHFMERLIATISFRPDKWAPLIQFLHDYERKDP